MAALIPINIPNISFIFLLLVNPTFADQLAIPLKADEGELRTFTITADGTNDGTH